MIDLKTSKIILDRLQKQYPDVRSPLRYGNLYQLSIAVVLSAQTTDNQVNMVTPILFATYPDFRALANASIDDVERIIRPTGFYHNKAKHIVAMANAVIQKYNGELPNDRKKLMILPGVGRKSANIILAMGFGIPAIPVDTHVARVAWRIGYGSVKKPLIIEESLMASIPKSDWIKTHFLFIYHGRALCTARRPKCYQCPIIEYCFYENKNLEMHL